MNRPPIVRLRRRITLLLALFMCQAVAFAQLTDYRYVRIQTDKGDCIVKLYNETPKHRDNFSKLALEGYYDGLLFHRVIENFMIQGGDPNSRYAGEKQRLGEGGPDYRIDAEFNDSLYHKKGVIAAARNDNPEKASSGSHFYLVQGRTFTDAGLDSLEQLRLGGRKIPPYQREVYKSLGGTPHLDQNYTVFGEVVHGIGLIDQIAAEPTDQYDRPLEDQRINMTLLTRREATNLERQLQGLQPKNNIFVRFADLFRSKYKY